MHGLAQRSVSRVLERLPIAGPAAVSAGSALYVMAFVGPVLDPNYATSLLATVIGIATGIPEVIGEVGTALWLAIRGARSGRAAPVATAP
jgi:hypothetical protein